MAIDLGDHEIINLLLKISTVQENKDNTDGNSHLMTAIRKGETKVVRYLFKNKKTGCISRAGWNSLLIAAAVNRQDDIVQVLMENGGRQIERSSVLMVRSFFPHLSIPDAGKRARQSERSDLAVGCSDNY